MVFDHWLYLNKNHEKNWIMNIKLKIHLTDCFYFNYDFGSKIFGLVFNLQKFYSWMNMPGFEHKEIDSLRFG